MSIVLGVAMDILLSELIEKLRKIEELEKRIQELENARTEYLPAKEYCKKFGISRTTFWKLRKLGQVVFIRVGKKIFVKNVEPCNPGSKNG